MKLFNLIFVMVVIAVSFSCKKDDDATPKNHLTIDGKVVAFPKAFRSGKASAGAETPGSSPTYQYSIWLSEKGVTYDSDNAKFTGTGKYLSLILKSTAHNDGELPAGTYLIDNEDISVAELSSLTATGEDFIGDEPTKGSITISKSASTYTIDLDLTMSGPGVDVSFPLKGHYVGTFTVID